MDSQAYITKITVDYNMHPCIFTTLRQSGSRTNTRLRNRLTSMLHIRMYAIRTVIAMQCAEILKISCGEKFWTNG